MSRSNRTTLMRLIVDNTSPAQPTDELAPLARIEVIQTHGEERWGVLITGRVVSVCGEAVTVAAEHIDGVEASEDGLSWLVRIPIAQVCDVWPLDGSIAEAI